LPQKAQHRVERLRERAKGLDKAVDCAFLRARRDGLNGFGCLGHGRRDLLDAAAFGSRGRDVRGDCRDFGFTLLDLELVSVCLCHGLLELELGLLDCLSGRFGPALRVAKPIVRGS
jgi:hypothetical protein